MHHPAISRIALAGACLLLWGASACSVAGGSLAAAEEPLPGWLQQRIASYKASKHPPMVAVRTWQHQGKAFYAMQAGCCDRFDELYDAQGQYLCAPSGGFTGMGDGKCDPWRDALQAAEGSRRTVWTIDAPPEGP